MQIKVLVAEQILNVFWQILQMQIGFGIGQQWLEKGKAVFSCILADSGNADGVSYRLTFVKK